MMTRRSVALATLVLLLGASYARADSELLSSLSYTAGEGAGWTPDPTFETVKFYLLYLDGGVALGQNETPYWREHETGTFDFTAETASNFEPFVAQATNGVNDWIYSTAELETTGAWAWDTDGWVESLFFGTDTDLAGYRVDFVRLIVDDVDFWVDDDGRFHMLAPITWEFWGGVPEPGCLVSLAFATLLVLRPRR